MTPIDEHAILDSLRRVPSERWGEVLDFLDALHRVEPPIQSGADLIQSPLIGAWAHRPELGPPHEFARQLRRQAETNREAADAAGH